MWVDDETGEIIGDCCPNCAMLEREARNYRAKITRLENDAERNLVAKRDGATWKAILEYWCGTFPDKKITSRGIKSARATKFFQRLEAGATPEDVRFAIDATKHYPYVTFGRRTKDKTRESKLAVDLQDVVAVNNDAVFDWLAEKGREMAKDVGW